MQTPKEIHWKDIANAPKDGRWIHIGWMPNGELEYEKTARWVNDRWEDGQQLWGWTPTHWSHAENFK